MSLPLYALPACHFCMPFTCMPFLYALPLYALPVCSILQSRLLLCFRVFGRITSKGQQNLLCIEISWKKHKFLTQVNVLIILTKRSYQHAWLSTYYLRKWSACMIEYLRKLSACIIDYLRKWSACIIEYLGKRNRSFFFILKRLCKHTKSNVH